MIYTKTNLFLAVLLVFLATLAWLLERGSTLRSTALLTSLEVGDIRQLRIENDSGPAIVLSRKENAWTMQRPYRVRANNSRIERLLRIANAPVKARFPAPNGALNQYGLLEPLARLTLNQLQISFGSTESINHYRYLAIDGDVALIHDSYPHLVLATAESYVSQSIIAQGAEIEEIITPLWRLGRVTESLEVWQLEPAIEGISHDLLTAKIDSWRIAQAVRITRPEIRTDRETAGLRIKLANEKEAREYRIVNTAGSVQLLDAQLRLLYEIPNLKQLLAMPGAEDRRF